MAAAERATTKASKAVTARQVGAPAAKCRSQREPVEPCASTRSPSRTTAVGNTTGWAPSATIARCPRWTVSSKRSSVARSLLALRDRRVIDVLLTGRDAGRAPLDNRGPAPASSSARMILALTSTMMSPPSWVRSAAALAMGACKLPGCGSFPLVASDQGLVVLAEFTAALSLAADQAAGLSLEHGLRTCLLATRLAQRAGLATEDLRHVYYTALLRSVGCTSDAHEQAELFGDEIAARAQLNLAPYLPARELLGVLVRHSGAGESPVRRAAALGRTLAASRDLQIGRASC